ncbi:class II aldolase/adducin family protein [Rubrobacter marinus]|uniref:Class II aldolase/adducin family protein n=1 Tax=Rubrobacter marinus TaxID=2653852 RepID=A0A6G8Q0L2_9ACTN|nr:class II aldolase/adducin family protein [Rubrobacter marinus]QIN80011.1 class II aldolase/adducin family protein [Rubrobacter marinus]
MGEPLEELREKVALACRILAMEGLVEGTLGHVSVRVPGTDDEMLIRCRGEEERGVRYTRKEAIRRVDLDGRGDELGARYEVPKEHPIHGETLKARPEVGSVIHAHPPATLICGITDLELRPIFGAFNMPAARMALDGVPVFPRSFLISRPELAAPLLETMGEKHVCVMRGHGVTVTGETVEEATVRALNLNTLARITLEAARTGRHAPDISPEDAAELPDLGSTFDTKWVWRYYTKKLEVEEANWRA